MTGKSETMRRSPIEIAIDAACGITPGQIARPQFVDLECRTCGATKRTWRQPSDPSGCAKIIMDCPKCCGDTSLIDYFDSSGRQINVA